MKTANEYKYKTKPFAHQREVFELSRSRTAFGFLMEQGTGKTKVAIDTAAFLYNEGRVQSLVVVAPNGVHYNWVDEIDRHLPDYIDHYVVIWDSGRSTSKKFAEELAGLTDGSTRLNILSINIDAVNTKRGFKAVEKILLLGGALLVCDESHTIKNPKALRTKKMLNLSKMADYRRILTGTPVTQSPLDLFTQFNFLDPDILKFGSYYAFRTRYAIIEQEKNWRTGQLYQVVNGYQNLEELANIIQDHSSRVLKENCLDLPPKLYQRVYVDLSSEQRQLYDALKDQLLAEYEGNELTVQMALVKMLRLAQITGGHFPTDGEQIIKIKGSKKIDALLGVVEQTQSKTIIWARFTPEINDIMAALRAEYGPSSAVAYNGEVDTKGRRHAVASFMDELGGARFFVGNPQAGGTGLDLWRATTVIYYSNDFSLTSRLQSEDRAHRVGQQFPVTYVDLVARDTIDQHVLGALMAKKSLADMITGDGLRGWLE